MGIIDNAKEIADLIKKVGDIDLYRKIIELEGEIMELTRQKRCLEEKNEQLEKLLTVKQEMVFRKPFYYQGTDPVPFCPKCWEADRKAIHIDGPLHVGTGPRYDCPNCKNYFIHPRRN